MKSAIRSLFIPAGISLAALIGGCIPEPAQSTRGPALPDPGLDQEYQVKFPEAGGGATRYIHLAIGADLSEDCGLLRAHFSFDSADPLPQDKIALRDVSDCLNRPELRSADIEIIGRADSRGTSAYNVELGRKRAEAVRSLLVKAGVAEERFVISSVGKADAVGDDKGMYAYGYDRRVDVLIRSTTHRPRGPH